MTRGHVRAAGLVVAAAAALAGGCVAPQGSAPAPLFRSAYPLNNTAQPTAQQTIAPNVPRELGKITLPEYVIEPPDVLRIEAVVREPIEDKNGKKIPGDKLRSLPLQPVWGDYTVRPDGTVFLGVYGSVPVAGCTLSQAAASIRETLAKQAFSDADGLSPEFLLVVLDVTQYLSKKYYVITDGGGAGEQVFAMPVTGSETVLDAVSNIYGLPAVASKRNIWVARRTPHPDQPEQLLRVDWIGITQHGQTMTNYQIMPGDRVYVKAQRLVTIDTQLARIISPIDRIFGVTLLGTSTINQINGRGTGFNGN